MKTVEACSGAVITPATSFVSDRGVLCGTCFGVWENLQRAAQSLANVKDAIYLRAASQVAHLHGVNWAVAIILLAGWVSIPGWLSGSLVAAVLVLAVALRLRSNLAFRAALVLDTAGSVAFLMVSVSQLRDGRILFLLFPVVFAWWLAFKTWRAREAFAAPSRLEIGQ